jgi:uncharacterized membrane protein YfcA
VTWQLLLAGSVSFVAGVLGGMVGLVLGSLRLPALLVASGNPAAAAGTNIAVSAAAAGAAGLAHVRAGRVDWTTVAWMAPPSVAAAFAGGFFGGRVPEGLLLGGIAVVVAWNGLDLFLDLRAPPGSPRRPHLAAALSGALIGLVGGAVGLILGTLRLPALLRWVGLAAHRAVGTNLVVGFFLGTSGFLGHLAQLDVEWLVLLVSLAGAIPGGWLGARLTGALSESTLRRAIGATLLAVAVAIGVAAVLG